MKVFNDIEQFKAINPVVTIGIFDGVHRGHIEILNRIKKLAKDYKGDSVVITLWPHPRFVLDPENKNLKLLASLKEKISLIEKQGIDKLVILPFDKQFANITYDNFFREFLVEKIKAKHIVVGYNHHFGKDRKGTYENLMKSAHEYGIAAERLDQVLVDNYPVSSSNIRQLLESGKVSQANDALGYHYFISGTVVEGNHLGKNLGYPTANIKCDEEKKLLPCDGVYAVVVNVNNKNYNGMLSIGIRPTIDIPIHERTIEVNIFDFNKDIYGENIQISFIEWIRPEQKMNSLHELKKLIDNDKKTVLTILNSKQINIL